MNTLKKTIKLLKEDKSLFWTVIWLAGLLFLWIWDSIFLFSPSLKKLETAFFNTILISILVTLLSLLLAWGLTMASHYAREHYRGVLYFPLNFLVNLLRSIPQILGILLGYIFISYQIENNQLSSTSVILSIALIISLFVFLEISDLMQERIQHFQKTDFYNSGRVCGISEFHLINFDILYKNSWIHIFNKLIAVFGMAIFLICSIDFIISVGLSTDVSAVNMPATLGSMLAQLDSKQDILAIGTTLLNPSYLPNLFLRHLQGISTAFLIVFSLLSMYKISNGFARKYQV
jgi:ABC-type amino acid transport system permease subunit